jgi:hypothetical protein
VSEANKDGRIVHAWTPEDSLSRFRQLGLAQPALRVPIAARRGLANGHPGPDRPWLRWTMDPGQSPWLSLAGPAGQGRPMLGFYDGSSRTGRTSIVP